MYRSRGLFQIGRRGVNGHGTASALFTCMCFCIFADKFGRWVSGIVGCGGCLLMMLAAPDSQSTTATLLLTVLRELTFVAPSALAPVFQVIGVDLTQAAVGDIPYAGTYGRDSNRTTVSWCSNFAQGVVRHSWASFCGVPGSSPRTLLVTWHVLAASRIFAVHELTASQRDVSDIRFRGTHHGQGSWLQGDSSSVFGVSVLSYHFTEQFSRGRATTGS